MGVKIIYILYVLLLSLFLNGVNCQEMETVVRQIPGLGAVKGQVIPAPVNHGSDVLQFTGIPFAQPPIGKMRFAPPEPASPWEPSVLDTTKPSPSCPQVPFVVSPDSMQEDCLFLNIWTPKISSESKTEKLPVLVWIYGGSLMFGSISQPNYYGDAVASFGNAVFVSINYRLIAFGFGRLPGFIPGNVGFLDQQLAFRWIQDNIGAFGGNPDTVTIFGESSGATSATVHLAAPDSLPLFKGVIPMSGSILDRLEINSDEVLTNRTLKAAEILGCPQDAIDARDYSAVFTCLVEKPFEEIITASSPNNIGDLTAMDNDELLFKGSISDQLSNLDHQDKTIVIGFTHDESAFDLTIDPKFTWKFLPDKKWNISREEYAYFSYLQVMNQNLHPLLLKAALWRYDNASVDPEYTYRMVQLATDAKTVCTERRTAMRLVDGPLRDGKGPKAIYVYIFNETTWTADGLGAAQSRASHASDIDYFLGAGLRKEMYAAVEQVAPDIAKFYRDMVKYLVNIAKYGDPNGEKDVPTWPETTDPSELKYRILQSDPDLPGVRVNYKAENCKFWEDLFEANEKLQKKLD